MTFIRSHREKRNEKRLRRKTQWLSKLTDKVEEEEGGKIEKTCYRSWKRSFQNKNN